jgi:hypothetical protein
LEVNRKYARIFIDFLGGAHGNYLEFICNKFFNVMPAKLVDFLPFNASGASHNKPESYNTNKVFLGLHSIRKNTVNADKYVEFNKSTSGVIVYIDIAPSDLLALSQISLLRSGDEDIDNNCLEINTYNKLNNINYRSVLDNIISSFFTDQIKNSYNAVKDPLWPVVNNINDYRTLPTHIQDECNNIHNLRLLELSAENADCPRDVLLEFFTAGFKNPSSHGFMVDQKKIKAQIQYKTHRVFNFNFSAIYDTALFKRELERLSMFLNIPLYITSEFYLLHAAFLEKQPYKDSKAKCDKLTSNTSNAFTLMEESYINSKK